MSNKREQLEQRKEELIEIINNLKKMIESTGSIAFEVVVETIKSEMANNIAEEDWKTLKQNQKKIESFRNAELIILNQETTLKKRQKELEEVQESLDNFQMELPLETESDLKEPTKTEIFIENAEEETVELLVGDIYSKESEVGTIDYWLVKKSMEHSDKFAIIRNIDEGEFELQYPKNKERLDGAELVGNVTCSNSDELKNVREKLRLIYHIEENNEKGEQEECQ